MTANLLPVGDPPEVWPRPVPPPVVYQDARSILTPASGFLQRYKFTLNPYSGCAFGCSYCYARFFALTAAHRDQWGCWLVVKQNARRLAARACRDGTLSTGDAVYLGSVTDPYQPIERRLRLTRGVLEAILECGVQPRLTIQTRSPLATRDLDVFQRFEKLRVNVTIGTDDDRVRRRYEPRCPPIAARFRAAQTLRDAGVTIGVSISPMLPITDIGAFAARLSALDAATYATQYLKPPGRYFAAGSTAEAIRLMREDGWGQREYQHARAVIARALQQRSLYEGANGYGPA